MSKKAEKSAPRTKRAPSVDGVARATSILDSCGLVHPGKRATIQEALVPFFDGKADATTMEAAVKAAAEGIRAAGQRFRPKLTQKIIQAASA